MIFNDVLKKRKLASSLYKTLPETSSSSLKMGLPGKEIHLPTIDFSGAFAVKLRGFISYIIFPTSALGIFDLSTCRTEPAFFPSSFDRCQIVSWANAEQKGLLEGLDWTWFLFGGQWWWTNQPTQNGGCFSGDKSGQKGERCDRIILWNHVNFTNKRSPVQVILASRFDHINQDSRGGYCGCCFFLAYFHMLSPRQNTGDD